MIFQFFYHSWIQISQASASYTKCILLPSSPTGLTMTSIKGKHLIGLVIMICQDKKCHQLNALVRKTGRILVIIIILLSWFMLCFMSCNIKRLVMINKPHKLIMSQSSYQEQAIQRLKHSYPFTLLPKVECTVFNKSTAQGKGCPVQRSRLYQVTGQLK